MADDTTLTQMNIDFEALDAFKNFYGAYTRLEEGLRGDDILNALGQQRGNLLKRYLGTNDIAKLAMLDFGVSYLSQPQLSPAYRRRELFIHLAHYTRACWDYQYSHSVHDKPDVRDLVLKDKKAEIKDLVRKDQKKLAAFFDLYRDNDLLPFLMNAVLSSDTVFPESGQLFFMRWLEERGIDATNLPKPAPLQPVWEAFMTAPAGQDVAETEALTDDFVRTEFGKRFSPASSTNLIAAHNVASWVKAWQARIRENIGEKAEVFTGFAHLLDQNVHPEIRRHDLIATLIVGTPVLYTRYKSQEFNRAHEITLTPDELRAVQIVMRKAMGRRPGILATLFDAAHELGMLPHVLFIMDQGNTFFPGNGRRDLERWAQKNGVDLDRLPPPPVLQGITQDMLTASTKFEPYVAVTQADVDGEVSWAEKVAAEAADCGPRFILEQYRKRFKIAPGDMMHKAEMEAAFVELKKTQNIGGFNYLLNENVHPEVRRHDLLVTLVLTSHELYSLGRELEGGDPLAMTKSRYRKQAGFLKAALFSAQGQADLFEAARRLDMLPYIRSIMMQADSLFPKNAQQKFDAWIVAQGIDWDALPPPPELQLITRDMLFGNAPAPAAATAHIVVDAEFMFHQFDTCFRINETGERLKAMQNWLTGTWRDVMGAMRKTDLKYLLDDAHHPEIRKHELFGLMILGSYKLYAGFQEREGRAVPSKGGYEDQFGYVRASLMSPETRLTLFDAAHRFDMLPYLLFALDQKDTVFPKTMRRELEAWSAEQGIDLHNLPPPVELKSWRYDMVFSDAPALAAEEEAAPAPEPEPEQQGMTLDFFREQYLVGFQIDEADPQRLEAIKARILGINKDDILHPELRRHVMMSNGVSSSLGLYNLVKKDDAPPVSRTNFQKRFQPIKSTILSPGDRRELFTALAQLDMLPYMAFFLEQKDSFFPKAVKREFEAWIAEQGIDLAALPIRPLQALTYDMLFDYPPKPAEEQVVEEAPVVPDDVEEIVVDVPDAADETQSEEPVEAEEPLHNHPVPPRNLRVIDVDELFSHGKGDDLLAREVTVERERSDIPKEPEYRWYTILSALNDVGIANEQITAYRLGDAYLFDIKARGERAQVYVEDYYSVYVIRDDNFHPGKLPLHRSESDKVKKDRNELDGGKPEYLLDRDDVWIFRLNNSNQVRNDLEAYIFTPKEDIAPQVKRIVSWANKGSRIAHSFAATVIATGALPKTTDRSKVVHGGLAQTIGATFSKASSALNDERVFFADEAAVVTSFTDLWRTLIKDAPMLQRFLHRDPLDLNRIIRDCDAIIEQHGAVLAPDFFDILKEERILVGGRVAEEIDFALGYGLLDTHPEFVGRDADAPHSLEALQTFLLARRDEQRGKAYNY